MLSPGMLEVLRMLRGIDFDVLWKRPENRRVPVWELYVPPHELMRIRYLSQSTDDNSIKEASFIS